MSFSFALWSTRKLASKFFKTPWEGSTFTWILRNYIFINRKLYCHLRDIIIIISIIIYDCCVYWKIGNLLFQPQTHYGEPSQLPFQANNGQQEPSTPSTHSRYIPRNQLGGFGIPNFGGILSVGFFGVYRFRWIIACSNFFYYTKLCDFLK